MSSWGGAIFLAGFQVRRRSLPLPLPCPGRGNVLGSLGCRCLSSPAPAPGCGVSSSDMEEQQGEQRTSDIFDSPAAPSAALLSPGLFLAQSFFAGWATALRHSGQASAPRPEAVQLSCWLIKAGCLGRPICSQVNCVAIFSLWQAYKKLPSVLPKDGRVVSCARACVPSLLSWRPTWSHTETAMCWYKRWGNTLPYGCTLNVCKTSAPFAPLLAAPVSFAFSDVSSVCSYMGTSF